MEVKFEHKVVAFLAVSVLPTEAFAFSGVPSHCSVDSECDFPSELCMNGRCLDPSRIPRLVSANGNGSPCHPECPSSHYCLDAQCIPTPNRRSFVKSCSDSRDCGMLEWCVLGKCVGVNI